jgi:hypothetical protein
VTAILGKADLPGTPLWLGWISPAAGPLFLALSLQVFLVTPHPTMPNLVLTDSEAADVIAYILSLKKKP